jgi:cysteine desulfurase
MRQMSRRRSQRRTSGESAQVERYSEHVPGPVAPLDSANSQFVYLDHAATTPMRPAAVTAMMPFLSDQFANPSGSHRFSRLARRALDESRDAVAGIIGCKPGEVVFTGCGSESDNAAITGVVRRHGGVPVCSAAEHHAVLHCVEHLGGRTVSVGPDGVVDIADLERVLREESSTNRVASVAVMAVNNEVGSVTDLKAVSDVVRRLAPDAVVHTDAVQAACWIDLRQIWPHVDTMALSAHKFGGPKGVGILVIRDGITIDPIIRGGGQERDRRSGTHNLPGIVATAEALRLTDQERSDEVVRIGGLRDRLISALAVIDGADPTIPSGVAVPGVVHMCLRGIESEALLYLLDEAGVCASAASACASGAMEPSHVLAAMGVERERAMGALRLSLGHTTTVDDVDRAAAAVSAAVERLRGLVSRSEAAS